MKKENNDLYQEQMRNAFSAESFKSAGYAIIDLLTEYLEKNTLRIEQTVLPNISPDAMMALWDRPFPSKPAPEETLKLLADTIAGSNHLHHPGYIGHQVTPPLPQSALYAGFGALLNNASTVYEMGPVNTIMEKRCIQWLAQLIGYDASADGVFTSGGTLGNLTALLAARQVKADYDIWSEGVQSHKQSVVLVSEQSHYSIKRALAVMGLGEQAAVPIAVDSRRHIDLKELRAAYAACIASGKQVFVVCANACSTATGSFDDLSAVADFCQEHGLWLHVDAAHGAPVLLSEKYRGLVKGIERADSVVCDAHKMLLQPALITAVIFKNGEHSYRSFSQKASYLFEKESNEEWYNYGHRTMECTKLMMGFRLYMSLMTCGTDFFASYVDSRIDLAKDFYALIQSTEDFESPLEPECNIVCFRFKPAGTADLDTLQKSLRKKVLESEKFYIVQTQLNDGFYLRVTIINPLTTLKDLRELLELIRKIYAASYQDLT